MTPAGAPTAFVIGLERLYGLLMAILEPLYQSIIVPSLMCY
jgi:hypothetical protein